VIPVWPFRRRSHSRPAPPGGRTGGGAPGNDWRSLAPIQRAVAAAPRIVEASFEATLATRGEPRMIGALEHAVLGDAPVGTAHGLAAVLPVAQRASEDRTFEPRRTERRWESRKAATIATPDGMGGGRTRADGAGVAAVETGEGMSIPSKRDEAELGTRVAAGSEGAGEPLPGLVEGGRPLTTAPPPPLPVLRLPALPGSGPAVQRALAQPGQPSPAEAPHDGGQREGGDEGAGEEHAGGGSGSGGGSSGGGGSDAGGPEAGAAGVQRAVEVPGSGTPSADPASPTVHPQPRPSVPMPPARRPGLGAPLTDGRHGAPILPSDPSPVVQRTRTRPEDPGTEAAGPADGPAAGSPSRDVQRNPSEPDPELEQAARPLSADHPPLGTLGGDAGLAAPVASGDPAVSGGLPLSGDTGGPDSNPPAQGATGEGEEAALPLLGRRAAEADRMDMTADPGRPGRGSAEQGGSVAQRAVASGDDLEPARRPGDPAGHSPLLPGSPPIMPEQVSAEGEPPVRHEQVSAHGSPPVTQLQASVQRDPPVTPEQGSAGGGPPDVPDTAPLLAQGPPLVPEQSSPLPPGLPSAPEQPPTPSAPASPSGPGVGPSGGTRRSAGPIAEAGPAGAIALVEGSVPLLGVQRAVEAVPSDPGRALLAHELVHVAQQRRLDADRPAEHTVAGPGLEREAVAVERAVTVQGLHQRTGAGEMVDPRSTALASGAASLDGDGAVVFQPPAGEPPKLSRSGADPTPAVQRAPADPPAETTPAVPGAPAALGGGAPTGDLDELARRLYDRIRLRLRAELRLDRERSGHLTDLRH
jgi:uncharacterized membrane protein YgcG